MQYDLFSLQFTFQSEDVVLGGQWQGAGDKGKDCSATYVPVRNVTMSNFSGTTSVRQKIEALRLSQFYTNNKKL